MGEYRPGMTTVYSAPKGPGRWLRPLFFLIVVAAAAGGAYYLGSSGKASPSGAVETPSSPSEPSGPGSDTEAGPVKLPSVFGGTGGGFEGALLFKQGRFDDAIRWLDDYLSGDIRRPNSDAALYYLGRSWEAKKQPEQAVACYRRLLDDFGTSPWTAKALARLAEITANETERARITEALWKKFPSTEEGKRAALAWADEAYRKYCSQTPVYDKWEEVRDAYSLAVEMLPRGSEERKRVVRRLARLNDALFYDPSLKPSGAFFVRVNPGDSLSAIASRYGVTVESIMRLNGLKNDVIRAGDNLKIMPITARILVDRKSFSLTLYINGKFFKEYPVGTGRAGLTPAGRFVIRNKIKNPDWYPRGKPRIPFGDPRNILGTRWLGFFGANASGLGIHGSSDPSGIGKQVSGGCIRMLNEDVEEVFDLVPTGTPVIIR